MWVIEQKNRLHEYGVHSSSSIQFFQLEKNQNIEPKWKKSRHRRRCRHCGLIFSSGWRWVRMSLSLSVNVVNNCVVLIISFSIAFNSIAMIWCFLSNNFSEGDVLLLLLLLLLSLLFYCRLRFCILHKWINYVGMFCAFFCLILTYAVRCYCVWRLATWKTSET